MTNIPHSEHERDLDRRTSTDGDGSTEPRSVEEIEADLEQARAELGETVDALTAKFDVKSRARDRVTSTKRVAVGRVDTLRLQAGELAELARDAATDDDGKLSPAVPVTAGAVVVAAAGIIVPVVRRHRRRVVILGVKAKR